MDKEFILRLSREENKNNQDEYELAAHTSAAKLSYMIGGYIAAILSLLGAFLFHSLGLSAGVCTLLFSMSAISNTVKYKKLKRKSYLIWCIADTLVSIAAFLSLFLLRGNI